jgi:hypothetical protein
MLTKFTTKARRQTRHCEFPVSGGRNGMLAMNRKCWQRDAATAWTATAFGLAVTSGFHSNLRMFMERRLADVATWIASLRSQ